MVDVVAEAGESGWCGGAAAAAAVGSREAPLSVGSLSEARSAFSVRRVASTSKLTGDAAMLVLLTSCSKRARLVEAVRTEMLRLMSALLRPSESLGKVEPVTVESASETVSKMETRWGGD